MTSTPPSKPHYHTLIEKTEELTQETKDDALLFDELFSYEALKRTFDEKFSKSTSKGIDRLSGVQFKAQSQKILTSSSKKCKINKYNFSPFLETLKTKGRDKPPRIIGIPTVRDRIILNQINKFLKTKYPNQTSKNVASICIRKIAEDMGKMSNEAKNDTWICITDIKTFYDCIDRERMMKILSKKITSEQVLCMIEKAISSPVVPKNTRRKDYEK